MYQENCPEFKDWVNCYIELNGMHCFCNDREWGLLLFHFWNGEVTIDDIKLINECIVMGKMTVGDNSELPDDIKYATYFNHDRDAINAALFEEHCENVFRINGNTDDSIMIFSNELKVRNSAKIYKPFCCCQVFWEGCSEDDVKTSQMLGCMDPVLRLYCHCCIMIPFNKNVKRGQANGMQAELEKVILKPGVVPQTVMLGNKIPIAAVLASQVERIILTHSNSHVQPTTFCVEPKTYTFKAKLLKPKALQTKESPRETVQMKAKQLPLLINNATTGHKLQGSGVDNLFVHSWSNVTNWVYVMLSHVKRHAGLFCCKKLCNHLRCFAVPEGLCKMLDNFQHL